MKWESHIRPILGYLSIWSDYGDVWILSINIYKDYTNCTNYRDYEDVWILSINIYKDYIDYTNCTNYRDYGDVWIIL